MKILKICKFLLVTSKNNRQKEKLKVNFLKHFLNPQNGKLVLNLVQGKLSRKLKKT